MHTKIHSLTVVTFIRYGRADGCVCWISVPYI